MTPGGLSLQSKAIWAVGSYGLSLALRLGTNIVMSRLLAPQILGVMVVVNSVKMGVELLTDVGVEANIVQNRKGLEPAFFNTAWTLQIIRGACLTVVFLAATPLLSSFYGIRPDVFLVISFAPLINSLASTSIFALVKNLEVRKRNLFELSSEFLSFLIYVALAFITPTVWALVIGAVLSVGVRAGLSYGLPHPKHRLMLTKEHVKEIIHFGKWIMISSLVIYAATYLDRIYLGKVVPFELLGIYGLARTIAELPPTLANRLAYQVIFPVISHAQARDTQLSRAELASTRMKFVLLAALGLGGLCACADWAIQLLYDPRYTQAGWMLFVLLLGAWVSVLSGLNEAIVLGFGKPAYNSYANVARFGFLLVGLPAGYFLYGLGGAIAAVAASEISRYAVVALGQRAVKHTFAIQDALGTAVMAATLLGLLALRSVLGLGTPWEPIVS